MMTWMPAMRRELSAVIGTSRPAIVLALFYVYGLSSALVIGSVSQRPGVIDLAMVFWAGADLAAVVGIGACLSRFTRTVRELRLPVPAGTLRRVYALIGAVVIVVPMILFRIFVPEGRELIGATLIVPLGLWLPRLGRDLGWSRWVGWDASTSRHASRRRLHPVRSPSDVMRVFIGSAFAPIPAVSGQFAARLLLMALWGLGLVMLEREKGTYIGPASWAVPMYLCVTGGCIWIWLMTSLAGFINARPAAFAELALLPGLGGAARQRRALYWALLARPMGVWAFFSGLACLWAWSKGYDARDVVLVASALAFLTLFSGYVIILQLLAKRTVPPTKLMQVFQLCYLPLITANLVSSAVSYVYKLPTRVGAIALGVLLVYAAVVQFLACRYARRIARLPHPFLQ